METLPIQEVFKDLHFSLNQGEDLIVIAPPGAGKSTALPLEFLSRKEEGLLYLIQPRRLAAKNVATRLAQLLGEPLGKSVGYRTKTDNGLCHGNGRKRSWFNVDYHTNSKHRKIVNIDNS